MAEMIGLELHLLTILGETALHGDHARVVDEDVHSPLFLVDLSTKLSDTGK